MIKFHFRFFFWAFSFLILLLVGFLMGNIFLGFWGLKRTETFLKKGDFKAAEKNIFWAKNSFSMIKIFFDLSQPVFIFLGFDKNVNKFENFFSLTEVLSEGAIKTLKAHQEGSLVVQHLLNGEDIDLKDSLKKIKINLAGAFERFSLSQNLLSNFSGREPLVGSYLLVIKNNLPKARSLVGQAQQVSGVLAEILGVEGRRSYLLLFQNNMELRPTGGFIGSFGILTLEKGKIVDLEIQDVYFADGQLKGYVEPPPKLKEFLGQGGWYLRDANWDPDFPITAQQAEWFLEKEIGRKVDGVIGVNLFVVQRILAVLKEIELSDYGEKITSQNFFEKGQFYTEIGFFPGSTAKKDFLGAVSLALFEKLKETKANQLNQIIFSFWQSLVEKDILIFLHQEEARQLMARLNWDGALRQAQCKEGEGKCLEDYLLIVEANVGVNKANYFLQREIKLVIKIHDGGRVENKLTIFYDNKSPSETFPAGRYKNYLRIYTPKGSILGECWIENLECQIGETEEQQRKVFGFLVEVPVGEKKKIEISWSLAKIFENKRYLLLFQKQPGTRNDNLLVSLTHPKNLFPIIGQNDFLTGKGNLIYNTTLTSDLVFKVDFVREEKWPIP